MSDLILDEVVTFDADDMARIRALLPPNERVVIVVRGALNMRIWGDRAPPPELLVIEEARLDVLELRPAAVDVGALLYEPVVEAPRTGPRRDPRSAAHDKRARQVLRNRRR